ncbi:IclR family transcriptional regulator [Arcanobacterium haemolyticum]|nr:IclR family transcriptional regulator [Arcanobacterium haemolyticum]
MGTTKTLASVGRALQIVEFLAQSTTDGVPLTFIAKSLDINKATVYNTLATLREYDWVEQDSVTGYYRLGNGITPIAAYRTATQKIVDDLHPALVAISHRFNELVHLGSLTGSHIVYLDKVEPDRPIRVISKIGREAVAARTSLGRALIASLPAHERNLDRFLSDPSIAEARADVREAIESALVDNITRFDKRGWTEEVEENEVGIACVAVPISLPSGNHMAVSISTPVERLPRSQRAVFAHGIAEEVMNLPREAGFSVPAAVLK